MRPNWSDLERPGRADLVWEDTQPTFRSQVVGPRFEHICRSWSRWYASQDTLGSRRGRVLSGTLPDPETKTSHEIDVVVFGQRGEILAIGEAKWNEQLGSAQLRRLERIRRLLQARDDIDAANTRLLLFSGRGFTEEVEQAATSSDATTQLVDLHRLYHGS